jgi:la-related protein 1
MDSEGFVLITLIASFNRIKRLSIDMPLISEAWKLSDKLEVRDNKIRRRKDWSKWLPGKKGNLFL